MGRPWPISILASLEDAGIIKCATSLFNNLQKAPNTVTWNLIIKSHLDFGLLVKFCCCVRLGELGVKVDSFTLPSINRAVSSLKRDSLLGKMVHCVAMKLGFGSDLYFCNTMIEVYAKSWWVRYGLKVFDEMSQRDLFLDIDDFWNACQRYCRGYGIHGLGVEAAELFNKMLEEGAKPSSVT
ncbi:hypothetical protein NC653_036025 [Populus alba x Populus x berolinensis]|uniref:Pentatricopeptide repeat-containing protein n=1 Tax=Populus alba x Populus x berolinensis TaxID=444605 RepID=A0AAD6LIU8_9ROSI|nr:hypothetical protein NC653_036025 [Populus alba x Populus x berolinensis]